MRPSGPAWRSLVLVRGGHGFSVFPLPCLLKETGLTNDTLVQRRLVEGSCHGCMFSVLSTDVPRMSARRSVFQRWIWHASKASVLRRAEEGGLPNNCMVKRQILLFFFST